MCNLFVHLCVLQFWRSIFDKYDEDNDGRISLIELRNVVVSESYTNDIPEHAVQQILKRADENANGYIEYPEFLKMVCND
jgi:Ca2+-binding EF-hand superfamily protein